MFYSGYYSQLRKIRLRWTLVFSLLPAIALAAGTPVIQVAQADFNFGAIYRGDQVEHIFKIRNEGSDTLRIENVRSSCGCTVPLIGKRVLAPREATELKAMFDSGRFKGEINKNIFVYSNDPQTPVKKLSIQADVKMDLEVSPGSIYFSGLKAGERVERKLTIRNYSTSPVTVKEIASTVPDIKLELSQMKIAPGDSASMQLVIDPVTKDMKLTGTLTVYNSSHQNAYKVELFGGTIN